MRLRAAPPSRAHCDLLAVYRRYAAARPPSSLHTSLRRACRPLRALVHTAATLLHAAALLAPALCTPPGVLNPAAVPMPHPRRHAHRTRAHTRPAAALCPALRPSPSVSHSPASSRPPRPPRRLPRPVHLPLKLAQFCLRAPLASTLVLRIPIVGFLAAQSNALARVHPQLPRSSCSPPHLALPASLKPTLPSAPITEDTQIAEAPISALLVLVPEVFPFHAYPQHSRHLQPRRVFQHVSPFLRHRCLFTRVPQPFRARITFTFTAGRAQRFVAANAATVPGLPFSQCSGHGTHFDQSPTSSSPCFPSGDYIGPLLLSFDVLVARCYLSNRYTPQPSNSIPLVASANTSLTRFRMAQRSCALNRVDDPYGKPEHLTLTLKPTIDLPSADPFVEGCYS
ncbi:hypothetical protein B0H19DRAFT_1374465 [Mycena capillaripes]|nr:hypothetical protein B0H19DRAFT_1374465 [Mycena capillaripes]